MRNATLVRLLFLCVIAALLRAGSVSGAVLKVAPTITAGDLFLLELSPDIAQDKQIWLQFDASELQFMGAVQGTPDIQIKNENEIEIKPESGTLANLYELKFLALIASGSSAIKLRDQSGERAVDVVISVPEAARGYSWLILLGGIILLIAGIKVWRYQKSAPAMMSTKSLFMNYAELEKARKMYFPEDDDGKTTPNVQSGASSDNPSPAGFSAGGATAESPAVALPGGKPAMDKASSGNKTQQNPVVSTHSPESDKHLRSRLAALFNDDNDAHVSDVKNVVKATEAPPAGKSNAGDDNQQPAPPLPESEAVAARPVLPTEPAIPPVVLSAAPLEPSICEPSPAETRQIGQPVVNVVVPPEKVSPPPARLSGKLVFAIEDGSGRVYEATGPVVRIGRKKENQICITASEISREHAEVMLSNGVVSIRSLTESNTTRLNNRSVKDFIAVKPGDTINLGGTDFVVQKARPV